MKIWDNKYQSAINSAVRSTVTAGRYGHKLCDEKKKNGLFQFDTSKLTGSLFMNTDGDETVVAGCGSLLDSFLNTGRLSGYAGEGEEVCTVANPDYYSSTIGLLRFDQSFSKLPYDVTFRKYIDL